MRRGLMAWRDDELGEADLVRRQEAMLAAMEAERLDAVLAYTNLVRPAAVAWLTGFTPYWSDALLLMAKGERPLFATALSKRVGNWIASLNPTAEIAHSPRPGALIAKRLADKGMSRIGIVEPDLLPSGLEEELAEHGGLGIVDASALFARVRGTPDPSETLLARKAAQIAASALDALDRGQRDAGAVAGDAERVVRRAGAEECYIAIAPDLARDTVFRRPLNGMMLGGRFAIRLSVAYHGVWVRVTQTVATGDEDSDAIQDRFAEMAAGIDPGRPVAPQLAERLGFAVVDWWLEGPMGTLPLAIAARMSGPETPVSYGVLGAVIETARGPVVCSRPVGLPDNFSG